MEKPPKKRIPNCADFKDDKPRCMAVGHNFEKYVKMMISEQGWKVTKRPQEQCRELDFELLNLKTGEKLSADIKMVSLPFFTAGMSVGLSLTEAIPNNVVKLEHYANSNRVDKKNDSDVILFFLDYEYREESDSKTVGSKWRERWKNAQEKKELPRGAYWITVEKAYEIYKNKPERTRLLNLRDNPEVNAKENTYLSTTECETLEPDLFERVLELWEPAPDAFKPR